MTQAQAQIVDKEKKTNDPNTGIVEKNIERKINNPITSIETRTKNNKQ